MIPVKVVADERERASGVPEELSKLGVRVYFSQLRVGDYAVTPEIGVERKTVQDLVSSIYDSRIFYQAHRISSSYAKPYLLIEGDSKEVAKLASNIKSYYGAIASVSLAYGLRMLFTANQRETAIAIEELARNARSRPVTLARELPPKSKSVSQQQLYMVSSLPGVGTKLAKRLLLKFGTPRRIMNLTEGELSMTAGIGWKKAERIKHLLDERYAESADKEAQTKLSETDG